MKRMGLVVIVAFLGFFLVLQAARAAGPEDPYFRQWASFKVGSSVTYAGRAEEKGSVSAFGQTLTLKGMAGDYLTLEISRKEEGVKPVFKDKNVDRFLGNKDKSESRGQEEIDVAGKKLTCQRYTDIFFDDSGKEFMRFDYWFHPDIPGAARIVGQAGSGTDCTVVSQTAVSWERK